MGWGVPPGGFRDGPTAERQLGSSGRFCPRSPASSLFQRGENEPGGMPHLIPWRTAPFLLRKGNARILMALSASVDPNLNEVLDGGGRDPVLEWFGSPSHAECTFGIWDGLPLRRCGSRHSTAPMEEMRGHRSLSPPIRRPLGSDSLNASPGVPFPQQEGTTPLSWPAQRILRGRPIRC